MPLISAARSWYYPICNERNINYEYNNGKIVFKDNINIKAGGGEAISADVILKAYVYSTYKEQSENSVYDEETGAVVDVPFNTEKTMKGEVSFVIGSYEITNMTISQASTNVYLNDGTMMTTSWIFLFIKFLLSDHFQTTHF